MCIQYSNDLINWNAFCKCIFSTLNALTTKINHIFLQAKSEDQLSHEKAWLEAENVWLVHRDGFAAGRQIKESEAGEPLHEGICSDFQKYKTITILLPSSASAEVSCIIPA